MTTKEISQQIVSSIFAEIPIEIDNAQDQMEIEEEMEAIVYDGVERFRKSMLDNATSLAAEIFSRPEIRNFDKALEDFRTILNENKE